MFFKQIIVIWTEKYNPWQLTEVDMASIEAGEIDVHFLFFLACNDTHSHNLGG